MNTRKLDANFPALSRCARKMLILAVSAAVVACTAPREEAHYDRDGLASVADDRADSPAGPVPAPNRPAVQGAPAANESPQPQPAHAAGEREARDAPHAEHAAGSSRADLRKMHSDSAQLAFAAPNAVQSMQTQIRAPSEPTDRERYQNFDENPVRLAAEDPVSTFSIDVDTGSYANVRRFLEQGRLPPRDAVRVEEMINYFGYDYPVPGDVATPFRVNTEVAVAHWNRERVLLQVGIKGYEVSAQQRQPANLVFLIDVSGSMNAPDKLPLLKNAFKLLIRQLDERDRVAMVVYAGATGAVLEPTPGDRHGEILAALGALSAGGRTNGAAGIRLAYDLAADALVEGVNRVILATDGDFNVGTVDHEALLSLIERERERGISLTTLGFGTGNYNDHLMERIADAGNGNYAYIDSLKEARKVLGEEMTSTLQTIAKDVKIQVEFNPATVAEYRLIGYENRMLRREDFNNDRIDAGEIGAGHTVTALYELALTGSAGRLVDPLRYAARDTAPDAGERELAFVRLRYKAPDGDTSRLLEQPVLRSAIRPADEASQALRFAAAVAAFGQHLRGADHLGGFAYEDIADLAVAARGEDRSGYRGEFVSLVRLAESLDPTVAQPERQALR